MVTRQSRFFIGAERESFAKLTNLTDSNKVSVGVSHYFIPKAFYWNETEDFGSGLLDCRRRDPSLKSCEWKKIFSTAMTGPFRNSSAMVGLTEYDFLLNPFEYDSDVRLWCDSSAYLGFPTYVLDPSPVSNPHRLVTMRNNTNPEPNSTPLEIDPDWLLAAWSVDHNGTVDGNRAAAQVLSRLQASLAQSPQSPQPPQPPQLDYGSEDIYRLAIFGLFHIYSTYQAMSMITYSWADPFNSTAGSEDASHPVFRSWATRHVWAYGSTTNLAAMVVIAGALCVLLRIALTVFGGGHRYTVIEFLVAALEHIPRGEFLTHHTEKAMAKVRFQLREDDDDGKIILLPERTTTDTIEL